MGRGKGKSSEFYAAASSCSDLYRACLPLQASSFLSNAHPKKCRPARLRDKTHTVGTCFTVTVEVKSVFLQSGAEASLLPDQTLSTSDL